MSKRFMRIRTVLDETGLKRSAVFQGMKAGTFPKNFLIGERMVAWSEEDIEEWKQAKLREARKTSGVAR